MKRHRLRAPAADGELLAAPPLSEAPAHLLGNKAHLAQWDYDFQGRRAGRLRAMARHQALAQAKRHLEQFGLRVPAGAEPTLPWIMGGHQPELFHAGVWVKNFAIAALAHQERGVGLNLIVDNDIPKGSSIAVPARSEGVLRAAPVAFDTRAGEVPAPYEDTHVRDEALFGSFPERVHERLNGLVADPILDQFWPKAKALAGQTDRVGLRFAVARRALEEEWGATNLEVPLSAVCETEGFLWFASHLLARLPRFQAVHNAALGRYRALHGIRSKHHPVPALGREDEWLEAPFWVWRADHPRRHPLFVRQLAKTMHLRIGGENEPFAELPLAPDREACCAVEQLLELPARQIRLRTRALTTTLFARLLLADLFVHGIGGAKYDELGDAIIHEFFGIEPPAFLALSMTLWLGVGDAPASAERLHEVEHGIRDLVFNPDRHPPGAWNAEQATMIEAKRQALAAPVATRRERITRFHAIHRANDALQGAVEPARQALKAERERLIAGLRENNVAHSREYAFVLHSQERFRHALAAALPLPKPPAG